MKKRLLSITLAVALIICMIPAQCYAATFRSWKATIAYNLNGADGAMESTVSASTQENSITLAVSSETPQRDGYTFAGWALLPNGTARYTTGQSITFYSLIGLDQTRTLYAVWVVDADPAPAPEDPDEPDEPVNPTYFEVSFPCYSEEYDNVELTGKIEIASGTALTVCMGGASEEEYQLVITGPAFVPAFTTEEYVAATSGSGIDGSQYVFKGFRYYSSYQDLTGVWEGVPVTVNYKEYFYGNTASEELEYGSDITLNCNGGYIQDGEDRGYYLSLSAEDGLTIPEPVRDGYRFAGWKIDYDRSDFALVAVWKTEEIDTQYKDCEKDNSCLLSYYYDISADAWYHDGVHFCVENDILLDGVQSGYFYPGQRATKGELAASLYKLSLEPDVSNEAKDQYKSNLYADNIDPLVWAIEAGIVKGDESGEYGFDNLLTREEAATMIFRYETLVLGESVDIDLSAFNQFIDTSSISSWAQQGMQWLSSNSILQGISGKLFPQGYLTRAQLATILVRVYELNQSLTQE